MPDTPHPRIVEQVTIPADANPGTLAQALLVLAEGIELKAGHDKQGTPTSGRA